MCQSVFECLFQLLSAVDDMLILYLASWVYVGLCVLVCGQIACIRTYMWRTDVDAGSLTQIQLASEISRFCLLNTGIIGGP